MKKLVYYPLFIAVAFAIAGCNGGTQVIDTADSGQVADMRNTMQLEFRDWENVAGQMTQSMIDSGALSRQKNPVIAIGRVTNDTMQRFDTDILVKKIRSDLVNRGHAQVTTALRNGAAAEDETTHNVREQRNNAEFNKSTIAGTGTLVAPNMSISGKMIQRNIHVETCWLCRHKERVEYYLQLTLTDVKTGLTVWETSEPIIKEGRRAPTW